MAGYMSACIAGAAALIIVALAAFFIYGEKGKGFDAGRILQAVASNQASQLLWDILLLGAFPVAAIGSYLLTEPGRRLRRAAAAKRQIVHGRVTYCGGLWVKSGGKGSSWKYKIEIDL
ncbi:MAG: hypothetical protein ACYDBJ_28080 [Aggregatilineales bacterium]